jgi:hypothetical protein
MIPAFTASLSEALSKIVKPKIPDIKAPLRRTYAPLPMAETIKKVPVTKTGYGSANAYQNQYGTMDNVKLICDAENNCYWEIRVTPPLYLPTANEIKAEAQYKTMKARPEMFFSGGVLPAGLALGDSSEFDNMRLSSIVGGDEELESFFGDIGKSIGTFATKSYRATTSVVKKTLRYVPAATVGIFMPASTRKQAFGLTDRESKGFEISAKVVRGVAAAAAVVVTAGAAGGAGAGAGGASAGAGAGAAGAGAAGGAGAGAGLTTVAYGAGVGAVPVGLGPTAGYSFLASAGLTPAYGIGAGAIAPGAAGAGWLATLGAGLAKGASVITKVGGVLNAVMKSPTGQLVVAQYAAGQMGPEGQAMTDGSVIPIDSSYDAQPFSTPMAAQTAGEGGITPAPDESLIDSLAPAPEQAAGLGTGPLLILAGAGILFIMMRRRQRA